MSQPAVIRIFFAIDLPHGLKEKVGQFITAMKKTAKSNGIRWTNPENLHVTLQFLAEVKLEDVDNLLANVSARLKGVFHPFSINFGNLDLLPSPFKPRVIIMDLVKPQTLSELAALISDGVQYSNYPTEDRPYRPHLTLGRIKHKETNLEFLHQCEPLAIEEMEVNEVVLFRSDPSLHGSKYTPLAKIRL